MKVLGLSITKNIFGLALLEKAETPTIIKMDKFSVKKCRTTPEQMNWFENVFIEIINKYQPDIVSYRIVLNPDKDGIVTWEFPLGVLNCICYKRQIDTCEFTSSKIGAVALTLFDSLFGAVETGQNKEAKQAAMAAYYALGDKR